MELSGQPLTNHGIHDQGHYLSKHSATDALCSGMHRLRKEVCGSYLSSSNAHFLLDPRFLSFILTGKFVIDE